MEQDLKIKSNPSSLADVAEEKTDTTGLAAEVQASIAKYETAAQLGDDFQQVFYNQLLVNN